MITVVYIREYRDGGKGRLRQEKVARFSSLQQAGALCGDCLCLGIVGTRRAIWCAIATLDWPIDPG